MSKNFIKKLKKIFCKEIKIPVYIPVIEGKFLENKNILITGGTGGLGMAIATVCLKNGANLMLSGRSYEKLNNSKEKLIKELPDAKDRIQVEIIDMLNIDSFYSKIKDISNNMPRKSIDVLINNAGLASGHIFGNTKELDFDITLDTNLKGTYFLTQEFAKYLIENKIHGNILNISSVSGIRPAISPYMISKRGITALTEGLAKKLIKYNIVVNGIAPGPVANDMLGCDGSDLMYSNSPSQRYVDSIEIGNLATYLISDMGRIIVGDTVYITGGCGTLTLDDSNY